MGVIVGVLGAALVASLVGVVLLAMRASGIRKRFSTIVNVDDEVARLRAEAARDTDRLRLEARRDVEHQRREAEQTVASIRTEAARLDTLAREELGRAHAEGERLRSAAHKEVLSIRQQFEKDLEHQAVVAAETTRVKTELERLSQELRSVEGSLDDISFGLYKPHYKFDTPEKFKKELERVKDQQKEMIRAGNAASFRTSWTIQGSTRDGEKMQKQYSKLLLRAFNGESDACIAKVNWNNATKMEERIRKAFDAINQLGDVMTVSIAPMYRELKLAELRLEHELEEKKRDILEEQRRIREEMKDEERAQREAEKAQQEAESEEMRFQKALEKAKIELSKTRGEEHVRMSERLIELQTQLADAQARTVRAKSMAELTKAGYVYIISNVGSFGDKMFKIGMTRRLSPMDRVKELGDASVPFPFDVHAMVYSENAPALENAFHQHFKHRSVNLINMRREFFHVDLTEIEAFATSRGLGIAFTKIAEAREYRESEAMRSGQSAPTKIAARVAFNEATAAAAM